MNHRPSSRSGETSWARVMEVTSGKRRMVGLEISDGRPLPYMENHGYIIPRVQYMTTRFFEGQTGQSLKTRPPFSLQNKKKSFLNP